MQRKTKISILFSILAFAACDGGIETNLSVSAVTSVQAPSLEEIRAALQASNTNGMVVGRELNDIVLPVFTRDGGDAVTASTCYAMDDIPAWLEFDVLNHTIRLASDQSVVPTEAAEAVTVTYACNFGGGISDEVSFVLNDMDGGGLVDQIESSNSAVPLVNRFGTLNLDPDTASFFLIGTAGVASYPNAITVVSQGFDPSDASDDTGDFDGDGISNDEEVADGGNVFVRTSSANFANVSLLATGNYRMPVVADYDADGNLDVAAANLATIEVDFYFGDGTGAFSLEAGYPMADDCMDLQAADFDQDGDVDLLMSSEGTSDNIYLSLLRNDGDGTFAANEVLANGAPGDAAYMSIADLDGDGDYDIVDVRGDDDILAIQLGDATGDITLGETYAPGQFPGLPSIADLNHDGFADIVLTQLLDANLGQLFGDGTGAFEVQGSVPVTTASSVSSLGDINNDGHVDVAVNSFLEQIIQIRFGTGTGLFSVEDDLSTSQFASMPILADYNGDGYLDLAFPLGNSDELEVRLGDGTGEFVSVGTQATCDDPSFMAPGDFDNDGDLDLVLNCDDGDLIQYFENQ